MLCQHDQNRAIQYLLGQLDNVAMWGDILQMAVLELIRKVSFCRPFAMKMRASASGDSCKARLFRHKLGEAARKMVPSSGKLRKYKESTSPSMNNFVVRCASLQYIRQIKIFPTCLHRSQA